MSRNFPARGLFDVRGQTLVLEVDRGVACDAPQRLLQLGRREQQPAIGLRASADVRAAAAGARGAARRGRGTIATDLGDDAVVVEWRTTLGRRAWRPG